MVTKEYLIDIEGAIHSWGEATITTEEIAQLGGWDDAIGVIVIDLKHNTERSLAPGEIVELKPGMGFSKKVGFKRG